MKWSFTPDRPIYTQLTEQLKLRIVSGEFPAGQRLPPVRELAAQAGVNPNTMQRSLLDLEREGLMYSQRTIGRFVTEDQEAICQLQRHLAENEVNSFVQHMDRLGYNREALAHFFHGGELSPTEEQSGAQPLHKKQETNLSEEEH